MCTLSFLPTREGFRLAMNRDESLRRPAAFPPRVFPTPPARTVYPHELGGGTWIAANEMGIVLALLNRNPRKQPHSDRETRGVIIPKLIASTTLAAIRAQLDGLDLRRHLPFLLVGFSGGEGLVLEATSDGGSFEFVEHRWEARHWFSSGVSEDLAIERRSATCAAYWRENNAGTEDWLRALHRHHHRDGGPFSICVHREGAGTVSYTEILVGTEEVVMRYGGASPCTEPALSTTTLARTRPASSNETFLPQRAQIRQ
jgi:Transport and Golgi organisation 2